MRIRNKTEISGNEFLIWIIVLFSVVQVFIHFETYALGVESFLESWMRVLKALMGKF